MAEAASQARRPHGMLPDLTPGIEAVRETLQNIFSLLRQHCLFQERYYTGNAASLYSRVC